MEQRLQTYSYIKGFNDGSLLFLKSEGHLFVRKGKQKNGKEYWVCYETIVLGEDGKPGKCTARCTLNVKTNECWRNETPHIEHETHEIIYRDLKSLNAMKDHCRYLAKHFPFSAKKIPISEIFLTEMAK